MNTSSGMSPFSVSSICALILLAAVPPLMAREKGDLTGIWEGEIVVSGGTLGILVEFKPGEKTEWTGSIDIAVQGARGLPLDEIIVDAGRLSFVMPRAQGDPFFDGALSDDGKSVAGTFTQGDTQFPFEMAVRDDSLIAFERSRLHSRLKMLRDFIDTALSAWHVPGLAIAVVHDGNTVLTSGFGQRDVEGGLAVTRSTLFPIGSATQSFTAAAAAAMVGNGRLDWDEPLRTYLPEFKMWDGMVGDRITTRDLLAQRSGLPGHHVLTYNTSLSREDLIERVRYLEPSTDFRTAFQRQDLMYTVVGHLIGQINKSNWEEALHRHLLSPLRISQTVFSLSKLESRADHARPYRLESGTPASIPYRDANAVGPALAISTNAVDMARWLDFLLRGGTTGQAARLLSDRLIAELYAPQTTLPPVLDHPERQGRAYGMGWFVETYRGRRHVFTDGTIDGFSSMISFFPEEGLGVAVLSNLESSPLPEIVALYASDLFLDLEPIDFHGRNLTAATAAEQAQTAADQKARELVRHKNTKPTHKLSEYAARYEHPAYGRLTVEVDDGHLRITYDSLVSELKHRYYDIFRGEFPQLGNSYDFHFITNDKGDIARVTVLFELDAGEIVFTRLPTERLENPRFLSKLAGDYDLVGKTIRVEMRRDQLFYRAPGQPEHLLIPYRGTEFEIADLSGYSIEFVVEENDVVKELLIRQPSGVFSAQRHPDIVSPGH